ncbi:hypothetical protein [Henriciella sp.]|uniref:hypothetical protein n=1 Tax=Henriciella sp. TaxID=1968823 RepID=UPI0026168766|nr:hypothetical protein [Henriciella sp.]
MSFGLVLALAFELSVQTGPIDRALQATEVPETFRAAFTVRLNSDNAMRELRFDPRLEEASQWQLVSSEGKDDDLDDAVSAWQDETVPDGRLFPGGLRGSLGNRVDVNDYGKAWRIEFQHIPYFNNDNVDSGFASHIDAALWMEPRTARVMRLDYSLPEPVRGPEGVRLVEFEQSFILESDPVWGLSYVSSFAVDIEAEGRYRRTERDYVAQVTSVEFFFSSPEAEARFKAQRQTGTGPDLAER